MPEMTWDELIAEEKNVEEKKDKDLEIVRKRLVARFPALGNYTADVQLAEILPKSIIPHINHINVISYALPFKIFKKFLLICHDDWRMPAKSEIGDLFSQIKMPAYMRSEPHPNEDYSKIVDSRTEDVIVWPNFMDDGHIISVMSFVAGMKNSFVYSVEGYVDSGIYNFRMSENAAIINAPENKEAAA